MNQSQEMLTDKGEECDPLTLFFQNQDRYEGTNKEAG
jgi:hypothetical protein